MFDVGASVALTFGYDRMAMIHAVRPRAVSTTGGDVVTITGANFRAQSTFCRFGAHVVAAVSATESEIKCVVGFRRPPGTVEVEVSSNGQDFSVSTGESEHSKRWSLDKTVRWLCIPPSMLSLPWQTPRVPSSNCSTQFPQFSTAPQSRATSQAAAPTA